MTKEDIIRLAQKAGIAKHGLGWTCWEGQLERFAALVLAQRQPLTIDEIEAILSRWNYETHGDRARYIVRETEAAHGIKETACT